MKDRFLRASSVAFRISGILVCLTVSLVAVSQDKTGQAADNHIVDVVAITRVFADGLKVSAVSVQYDKNIQDSSLKPAEFTVTTDVPAQKITKVYTSNDGLPTDERGSNGRYVILELSTDYIIPVSPHKVPAPPPGGRPPAPPGPRPAPVKQDIVLNPEVVTSVGDISWNPAAHPATLKSTKHGGNGKSVTIEQTGEVIAVDGTTLAPSTAAKDNVYVRNLIVDGFMKPDYATATQGNVKYNIHFPGNYDPTRKYPVVVFLSDSDSPTGFTHAEYLVHGLGGVVWADHEDDVKHPAIVIVPALPRPLINESYEATAETRPDGQTSTPYLSIMEAIDGLIQKIPSIDKSRIYLTGQGDGARAAIKMMEDRPSLYAAALLFAPDYDATKISPLAKARLWIVVSEGDTSSYSSMKTSVAALQSAGAHVSQGVWNGQGSPAQLTSEVHSLAKAGGNIKFTVLKQGTAVPSSLPDDAQDNHFFTWRIGYSNPALRDWLFEQKR